MDWILATCPGCWPENLCQYVTAGIFGVCYFKPKLQSYFGRHYVFVLNWKGISVNLRQMEERKKERNIEKHRHTVTQSIHQLDLIKWVHRKPLIYDTISWEKTIKLFPWKLFPQPHRDLENHNERHICFKDNFDVSSSCSFTFEVAELACSPATSCFIAFNDFYRPLPCSI